MTQSKHTAPPAPRIRPATRTVASGPVVLAALLTAGCAAVGPQPPAASPVSRIDVADVQADPEAAPAAVRWGGTIAAVRNTADGDTALEVVARPLAGNGRPRHVDASAGRFVAEIDGFLDPEIVRAGRDITVTGTVEGLREGTVGESGYRFPVVAVADYRYWKARARPAAAHGPYGPHPSYGPYGPGWIAPYGYAYDPFDFNQRFWHDFWHDPIHRPRPSRGGRVGVGVTVRP